jgi:hypothetical protein
MRPGVGRWGEKGRMTELEHSGTRWAARGGAGSYKRSVIPWAQASRDRPLSSRHNNCIGSEAHALHSKPEPDRSLFGQGVRQGREGFEQLAEAFGDQAACFHHFSVVEGRF